MRQVLSPAWETGRARVSKTKLWCETVASEITRCYYTPVSGSETETEHIESSCVFCHLDNGEISHSAATRVTAHVLKVERIK